MTIVTIETKITHKYLMGKTKDELASWIMRLIDENESLQKCEQEGCKERAVLHYCEKHDYPEDMQT